MITKVYIGGGGGQHDIDVAAAFLLAYPEYVEQIIQLGAGEFGAQLLNIEEGVYVRSTPQMSNNIQLALSRYPSVNVFMPAGSNTAYQIYNSQGILPSIVVTGAGDDNNETAWDIEFFAPDPIQVEPDLSSYANGFIAGQIVKIANTLGVSIWTARVLARFAGEPWTAVNGYGIVNVVKAIALYDPRINYDLLDPYYALGESALGEVGQIKVVLRNGLVSGVVEEVANATRYGIYKNGVFLFLIYGRLFTDFLPAGNEVVRYTYKGAREVSGRVFTETVFSDAAVVVNRDKNILGFYAETSTKFGLCKALKLQEMRFKPGRKNQVEFDVMMSVRDASSGKRGVVSKVMVLNNNAQFTNSIYRHLHDSIAALAGLSFIYEGEVITGEDMGAHVDVYEDYLCQSADGVVKVVGGTSDVRITLADAAAMQVNRVVVYNFAEGVQVRVVCSVEGQSIGGEDSIFIGYGENLELIVDVDSGYLVVS